MILAFADITALFALLLFHAYAARALSPLARWALALVKTLPLGALIFIVGPQGGAILAFLIAVFAQALTRLHAAQGGRAHLVAGLCAGALFASGPFGAVFVGAALLVQSLSGAALPLRARLADLAIILFVPFIVIVGFGIAAQAQTGDAFALTSNAAAALSPLSVWIAQWPASLIAVALFPCLAPNVLARGAGPDGLAARAVLGGALAALVTFGGTIDGIVESALGAALGANAVPVRRLKSISFLFLIAGGASALALCALCLPARRDLARVPYALWRIGQAPLDRPPPWGIDLAR